MPKFFILLLLLFISNIGFAQKNDLKLKPFFELQGKRAFSGNSTKYFGLNFGIRAKCKFKVGFSYSWLRGEYRTSDFPVDVNIFPDASEETETSAKFFSLLISPLVVTEKKLNISIPINLGTVAMTSDYRNNSENLVRYHTSSPFFGEIGADIDFRLSMILKFGISVGYRNVFSDLEVAQEAFSTPLFGVKLKLGRMCK